MDGIICFFFQGPKDLLKARSSQRRGTISVQKVLNKGWFPEEMRFADQFPKHLDWLVRLSQVCQTGRHLRFL